MKMFLSVVALCMLFIGNAHAQLFPGFPAASLPLTGSETIPADTNLSQGRQPQTELITVNQLKVMRTVSIGGATLGTGTQTVNAAAGDVWLADMTSAGVMGIPLPSNLVAGKAMQFIFQGNGTTTTLLWDNAYKFPNGVFSTPTTTSGKYTLVNCTAWSTTVIPCNFVQNIYR